MLRCFFRLVWDPIMGKLAEMLNFKTTKAKQCLQNVSDHHKGWSFFMTYLIETGDELILPYVKECIQGNTTPTLQDYMSWSGKLQDPTYEFVRDLTLSFAFAILLFRTGVRRNNHDLIQSARSKFARLFFITNTSKYAEIETKHNIILTSSPPTIKEYLGSIESFSSSQHASRHEGADYCLENYNRKTKRFKPPGVPSTKEWQTIIRNLKPLSEVYYV